MDLSKNILLGLCILMCSACPPRGILMTNENSAQTTLTGIYAKFKGGEIQECLLSGDTVYRASINAYDVSQEIYDMKGELIGTCNYAYNLVDSVCEQTHLCRVIYRGKDHISGQPAVDEYGLETE